MRGGNERYRGFTLIQISILLTIASLTLVTMLPSIQSQPRAGNSVAKLNNVLTVLRQYEATNGFLPCPADASQPISGTNYGVAAANSGATNNCTGGSPAANYVDSTNHVAIGMVPVRTLQVPNDYALDNYGRDITYAVDTNATGCWPSTTIASPAITVTDNGTANTTVVALVSHGADGHGAWLPLTGSSGTAVRLNAGSTDTNELLNAHVNSSFATTTPYTNFVNLTPTSTYNDLVVYKNPLWTMASLPADAPADISISSVTGPSNGSYYTSQTLSFTVNFSSAVTITGTPELTLTVGSNTRYATYASGSGTTAIVFNYTAQGGDYAPSGISVASPVVLNGGTITSGVRCISLIYTPPSLTSVLVNPFVIWVADTANNRVQELAASGSFITQMGCASGACTGSGSITGQFYWPQSLGVNSSGSLYVQDSSRIQIFSSSGTYLATPAALTYASPSTTNYQDKSLYGMTVNSSGSFWVADTANNRLMQYKASTGSYIRTIPASGCTLGSIPVCPNSTTAGKFDGWATYPSQDSGGNIWICDEGNEYVSKFNSTGSYITRFYTETTQTAACAAAAVNSSGSIWVTDGWNQVVFLYNASGSVLKTIGTPTSGSYIVGVNTANGNFLWPGMITIDSNGNIWVQDQGNNRIQEFSSGGTWLYTIPATGCTATTPPACPASTSGGQFGNTVDETGMVIVNSR